MTVETVKINFYGNQICVLKKKVFYERYVSDLRVKEKHATLNYPLLSNVIVASSHISLLWSWSIASKWIESFSTACV